jgi:kynureninase
VTDPAQLRHEFLLDPDVVFLNHGSFGACPRDVFAREHRIEIPIWDTGTIRASLQGYNTEDDLESLAEALAALLATTGSAATRGGG